MLSRTGACRAYGECSLVKTSFPALQSDRSILLSDVPSNGEGADNSLNYTWSAKKLGLSAWGRWQSEVMDCRRHLGAEFDER